MRLALTTGLSFGEVRTASGSEMSDTPRTRW